MKLKKIAKIMKKTKDIIKVDELYSKYFISKANESSNSARSLNEIVKSKVKSPEVKNVKKLLLNNIMRNNSCGYFETAKSERLLLPQILGRSESYRSKSIFKKPSLNSFIYDEKKTKIKNEFFYKETYSNLVYDENQIFNKIPIYNDIIRKALLTFIKEKKNDNLTTELSTEINQEIEVSLTSMKVVFNSITTPDIKFDIVIPFALTPIFYSYTVQLNYVSIESIKKILALIVKFNEGFTSITIDDSKLYPFLSSLYNKKRPPSSFRHFFEEISFLWQTPKELFVVKIISPMIKMKINSRNVSVRKFIDYELLFFLYNKLFLNWDFYVVNFLFGFKKFRSIVTNCFTKCIENIIYDINFDLDIIKHTLPYNSEKVYKLQFIATDKEYHNKVYSFLSCEIKLTIFHKADTEENKCSDYIIKLNLYQAKKLYTAMKIILNIRNFLMKFLTVKLHNLDRDYTVFFDKEKFEEFPILDYAKAENSKGLVSPNNCILTTEDVNNINNYISFDPTKFDAKQTPTFKVPKSNYYIEIAPPKLVEELPISLSNYCETLNIIIEDKTTIELFTENPIEKWTQTLINYSGSRKNTQKKSFYRVRTIQEISAKNGSGFKQKRRATKVRFSGGVTLFKEMFNKKK